LLTELRSFDYPLDQCLKLCQEFKMNEATAFLLERSGAVLEALKLYIEVIYYFIFFLVFIVFIKRFSKMQFRKQFEK